MSLTNMTRRAPDAMEKGEATALLGEFAALMRQLGAPTVNDSERQNFLVAYQASVLAPIELPAIARAAQLAAAGQCRELIALDAEMASEPTLQPFAEGSRQIGRLQLERLRPLRDDRLTQRYLAAVESGKANGWHTIVYGIMLAVYSWPLRQGLLHYAHETIGGLASVTGVSTMIDDARLRDWVDRAISENAGVQMSSMASP